MSSSLTGDEYAVRVAAESLKWTTHLEVEARGEINAWLDLPPVTAHYARRAQIDGLPWEQWVRRRLGGPATRSLDLGCGSGSRSLALWEAGVSASIEGVDLSAERVAEAERVRQAVGAHGGFRAEDVNRLRLAPGRYDLIFSAHSFHHFLALEHVLEQVHEALTPRGLFVLEEFVGPTQFQWTEEQMALTRSLLGFLPGELRRLPWGAVKETEGRPAVEEVVAVSPFESIRSGEIAPLFARFFDLVVVRPLGGTLQHLLYNGIAHNFWPSTEETERARAAIAATEDALIDHGLLPSDFQLLIGRRKDGR